MSDFHLSIGDINMLKLQSSGQSSNGPLIQTGQIIETNGYGHFSGDTSPIIPTSQATTVFDFATFLSPYNSTMATPKESIMPTDGMSPFNTNLHRSSISYQQEFKDQDDMFTPLVSPAMKPSYSYPLPPKHLPNSPFSSDINFSPLTSPAIMPQIDGQTKRHKSCENPSFNHSFPNTFNNVSSAQIYEQYEQLEQTKRLINLKLSELKSQNNNQQSNDGNVRQEIPKFSSDHGHLYSNTSNSTQDSSPIFSEYLINNVHNFPKSMPHIHSTRLQPVTPASIMNMKISTSQENMTKKPYIHSSTFLSPFSSSSDALSLHDFMTSSTMNTPTPSLSFPDSQKNNSPLNPQRSSNSTSSSSSSSPTNSQINPKPNQRIKSMGISSRDSKKNREVRAMPLLKKQRHEASPTNTDKPLIAPSPRALKPLLSPIISTGSETNPVRLNAERILATRSNYQNLMEGKAAALGIDFQPHIKSGIEVRRTAHKAAEQKRRDSLKEWFERLRQEVEDGYVKKNIKLASMVRQEQEKEAREDISEDLSENSKTKNGHTSESNLMEDIEEVGDMLKPLSKVLLLRYAYEYISTLKDTVSTKDSLILQLEQENANLRSGNIDINGLSVSLSSEHDLV
ncbi:hypothetical protein BDF14DRAFT_1872422 [Spinellus fusiger]|nr:hypothetical protein BDF14DRAFT_1872422 [Spinellus fusiger]